MKKLSFITSLIISCAPVDPPIIETGESTMETSSNSTENKETGESGKNPTTTNSIFTTGNIISTSTTGITSFNGSSSIFDMNLTVDSDNESSTGETSIEFSSETSNESSESSETSSEIECGNEILEEFEECDDGNKTDDDSCSNECQLPRIVFLTNDYVGLANFGGIDVADDICQSEAELFNVPGTFKAWLSDDNELNDPYYRFDSLDFKGWYKLLPYADIQLRIVKGWNGLSGVLENPINITSAGIKESGEPPMVKVFNATGPDGKRNVTGTTCNGWTVWDINMSAYVGSPQEIESEWYAYGLTSCGSETGGKLYCFQID